MGRDTLNNYRSREVRNAVASLLRTMSNEWHTGVGPEGQVIMRPIVRLERQWEEIKKLLDKQDNH